MKPVIFHNPACSVSRNTLALLRGHGIEPRVVEYLREPYSREQLLALLREAGLAPGDALRRKGELYLELGLDDPALGEQALLEAMLRHPVLIERPFVQTALGVRLCRPPERVLEILPVSD